MNRHPDQECRGQPPDVSTVGLCESRYTLTKWRELGWFSGLPLSRTSHGFFPNICGSLTLWSSEQCPFPVPVSYIAKTLTGWNDLHLIDKLCCSATLWLVADDVIAIFKLRPCRSFLFRVTRRCWYRSSTFFGSNIHSQGSSLNQTGRYVTGGKVKRST